MSRLYINIDENSNYVENNDYSENDEYIESEDEEKIEVAPPVKDRIKGKKYLHKSGSIRIWSGSSFYCIHYKRIDRCDMCHSEKYTGNTLKDYKKLAEQNGCEYILDYIPATIATSILGWRCLKNKNHPVRETSFNDIKRGHKCRQCNIEISRLSLVDYKKIAGLKNGDFLGTEIPDKVGTSVFGWKCNNPSHPIWKTSYNHIQEGSWCTECFLDNSIRLKIDNYINLAKSKGGEYILNYIPGCTTDKILGWRCDDPSHPVWESSYRFIASGCWCPYCSESQGERLVRMSLQSISLQYINIFYQAQKIIPQLPSLYFDFYVECFGYKILIEFDGIQHFELNRLFHKTEKDFLHRRNLDILKTVIALKEGYAFIRIDYTYADISIQNMIRYFLDIFSDSIKNRIPIFSKRELYNWIYDTIPIEYYNKYYKPLF